LREQATERGGSLVFRRVAERRSYYLEVTAGSRRVDFELSEEFLMDLPGMVDHQRHVAEYLPTILTRLGNVSPSEFFSLSGTPFNLKIHWPFYPHPSRDVIWCHADVEDLRFPELIAKTAPVIWAGLDNAEYRFRPFARIEAVVNAVRGALDKSQIHFHKLPEHPAETQEIRIYDRLEFLRTSDPDIEQFIAGKVFWLAFKQGDQTTKVWIADPWDAHYLGVSAKDLIQAAQAMQARGVIALAPDNQFASPGEVLLQSIPYPQRPRERVGFRFTSN
jgi:hypothetical protein